MIHNKSVTNNVLNTLGKYTSGYIYQNDVDHDNK